MSEPMLEILEELVHGVGNMTYGDPDEEDSVSAADVVRWAIKEIARLREERQAVQAVGDIIDMEYSGELGVYYGTIRCPTCDQDVSVCPMADRAKCRCGIEWDFSVSAVGEQPLPPGPEGDGTG